jgi:hypothetical protein
MGHDIFSGNQSLQVQLSQIKQFKDEAAFWKRKCNELEAQAQQSKGAQNSRLA